MKINKSFQGIVLEEEKTECDCVTGWKQELAHRKTDSRLHYLCHQSRSYAGLPRALVRQIYIPEPEVSCYTLFGRPFHSHYRIIATVISCISSSSISSSIPDRSPVPKKTDLCETCESRRFPFWLGRKLVFISPIFFVVQSNKGVLPLFIDPLPCTTYHHLQKSFLYGKSLEHVYQWPIVSSLSLVATQMGLSSLHHTSATIIKHAILEKFVFFQLHCVLFAL